MKEPGKMAKDEKNKVCNSTEKVLYFEPYSRSDSQEILRLLWNQRSGNSSSHRHILFH